MVKQLSISLWMAILKRLGVDIWKEPVGRRLKGSTKFLKNRFLNGIDLTSAEGSFVTRPVN
jgi:hypothetical protein